MKRNLLLRFAVLSLSLTLLFTPTVQALTVEQASELISELYVDKVPQSVLEQPTIDEMIAALGDPYTEYFTAAEYQDFMASMSDSSLVGIGVVFQITETGLLINQVLDGSPAQQGGLTAGDLITAVDGHSVLGADTETVTGWIQGDPDSSVSVTYTHDGKQEITTTLIRALVTVPATALVTEKDS